MNERFRAALTVRTAEMDALSDAELIAAWTSAGKRLLTESPDELGTLYLTTSALADESDLEPTLDNWSRLGARLARSARFRILLARLTAVTQARFEDRDQLQRAC